MSDDAWERFCEELKRAGSVLRRDVPSGDELTLAKGYRADVLDVRFEDLVVRPLDAMTEIADFFEIGSGEWIERAAALVKGLPPSRFDQLDPNEQRRLREACRPGNTLLATARTPG